MAINTSKGRYKISVYVQRTYLKLMMFLFSDKYLCVAYPVEHKGSLGLALGKLTKHGKI